MCESIYKVALSGNWAECSGSSIWAEKATLCPPGAPPQLYPQRAAEGFYPQRKHLNQRSPKLLSKYLSSLLAWLRHASCYFAHSTDEKTAFRDPDKKIIRKFSISCEKRDSCLHSVSLFLHAISGKDVCRTEIHWALTEASCFLLLPKAFWMDPANEFLTLSGKL